MHEDAATGSPAATGYWSTGMLAALAAAALMLALRLSLGVPTPVESVVDRIVPLVPMSWFETGLTLLGGYAKLLLGLLAWATFVLLGGAVALAYGRYRASRLRPHALWDVAVWTVGMTLVTGAGLLPLLGKGTFGSRTDRPVLTVLSYAGAALVFGTVVAANAVLRTPSPEGTPDTGRRLPLQRGLRSGGLLLLAAVLGPLILRVARQITLTDPSRGSDGLPTPVTSTADFYVVSKNLIDPTVARETWRLQVGGLVQRPFELTLAQLQGEHSVQQMQTLECISNPVGGNLIGNAEWRGVRLADLLQRAGVRPGAVDIKLTCADGYTESIPVSKAMEPTVVLAYEMNGAPLTDKHGGPARLLVPNIFGMKNVKWVRTIEAVPEDYRGYWQGQGWSDTAVVQTMSQVRVPGGGTVPRGQDVLVGGIAFAGSRGITRVEWSADGGQSWQDAELEPEVSPLSWRFWRAVWKPISPGEATLMVRATDGSGRRQDPRYTDTLPDGATGYHAVKVQVT